MINPIASDSIVKSAIGAKLVSKIPLRLAALGVLAYVGLRLLNKNGIWTKETGAALDAIDDTFASVKEKFMSATSSMRGTSVAAETSAFPH